MAKRIEDQVVVIVGASSGIGRAAALAFGRRGARVVVAARDASALDDVVRDLEALGAAALAVPTDVSRWDQVTDLASAAIERFGRIDTWVNLAAVSIYATVEQTTIEEFERVVDVNLLGQVRGVKAALPHLRAGGGGTIVNVGSVESRQALPLQGAYTAAKHGLKGFTDALRMELAHEGAGIEVVLVLPSSMNTPLFEHARSKLGTLPQPVPPIYEPSVTADAIVHAAEHPQREIVTGGAGWLLTLAERVSGRLVDRIMLLGGRAFAAQRSGEPDIGVDNLDGPMEGSGRVRGAFGDRARSVSWYTRSLGLHRARQDVLALGVASLLGGVALLGWVRPRSSERP